MRIWTFFVIMIWMLIVVPEGRFFSSPSKAGVGAAEPIKEEEKGKMDQEVSLPLEVAGWKWDGKEMKYNAKTLFDYIDGAAELYLAYGFQNLTVRRFEKSNRSAIAVELYEMASSEEAYGLFSFERQDEAIGIGQGSELGGGLLRFWKGKYFVSIYSEGEEGEAESAMVKAAKAVADSIPTMGLEPKLIAFIPQKNLGLVDKSVRYLKSHVLLNQRFFVAHQNILKLSRKTEAVLAQYLQDKQKTHLLLLRYANPKEAEDAYRSFMKAYLPEAGGKEGLKTEDRKWTFAWHRNEFVLIVFGAPTVTDAETLLKVTEEKLAGRREKERGRGGRLNKIFSARIWNR